MKVMPYTLINRFLYNLGLDETLWRCVLEHEWQDIIDEAHRGPVGGHNFKKKSTINIMVANAQQRFSNWRWWIWLP